MTKAELSALRDWATPLSADVEDWLESVVDSIMEQYEEAGTPLKGGSPIFEALCKAYTVGRNDAL
jgi:hypothetical protein